MSLSQPPAFETLRGQFVCGYRNIEKEPYAGSSGIHPVGGNAIQTSNGAGGRNVQMFVLAPDGTVMHALPGYWNPTDLIDELALARRLFQIYQDATLTKERKAELHRDLQLAHTGTHSAEMVKRSRLQGFDRDYEEETRPETSDVIVDRDLVRQRQAAGLFIPLRAFETLDRLLHERMATRPFVRLEDFDVPTFVDYGRPFYDRGEDQRDARGIR